MIVSSIQKFLKLEACGGLLLITAAVLARSLANSPWGSFYAGFLQLPVEIRGGTLAIAKPLLLWINDGLMAVFFFLVGLEIKREFLIGELSGPRNVILPAAGAVGGIAVPACIYLLINRESPQNFNGWAIPTARDIAFAIVFIGGLGRLNRLNVHRLTPYVLMEIALWVCVLKSGVRATLAGVITAFTIPIGESDDGGESLLERLEHNLHPWVAS